MQPGILERRILEKSRHLSVDGQSELHSLVQSGGSDIHCPRYGQCVGPGGRSRVSWRATAATAAAFCQRQNQEQPRGEGDTPSGSFDQA